MSFTGGDYISSLDNFTALGKLDRSLLRQAVEKVHRLNRGTRFAEAAEPSLVCDRDIAGTIKSGERTVHGQAERRIVARHHEAVRLVRKQNIGKGEAFRILRCDGKADQNAAVGGERVRRALLDGGNPLEMIFRSEERRVGKECRSR